ncbi:MAG: DUF438 domain-containing protein [Vicinamibacterales bacterium]|nr:DUF438 domain-containing protein [Vicinamibacterales bacterium]
MSELIDNARRRKDLLKHLIRQLHDGEPVDQLRTQLIRTLGQVPYGDVVAVEQELIAEGLPTGEILKLCDLHSAVLRGAVAVDQAREVPPGHPVHTFRRENEALTWEITELNRLYAEAAAASPDADASELVAGLRGRLNSLMDVDKHYLRKEHLVFPYLEKAGITGPPTVMWGKHDETRALLKQASAALAAGVLTAGEVSALAQLVLKPASRAVSEMIDKEEQILLPMCLDAITDVDWYDVKRQSLDYGYCLIDPSDEWVPENLPAGDAAETPEAGRIRLPSGSMTPVELQAILNSIPFDLTFVDKDDTVRYFTQGRERIFSRSRAILGRKVQYCHPPSSVKVVEQILADFKSGAQSHAAFWITMKGQFLSIEYFALRDAAGAYLGCLEVSQDLTAKRALTGEQRLLNYVEQVNTHVH